MTTFQITYQRSNGDWTWIDIITNDFQDAIAHAISHLPLDSRIHNIVRLP